MIVIGCDHGGYELKQVVIKFLNEREIRFDDFGCNGETIDYPDMAEKVCAKVVDKTYEKAILICGTGIGFSMAANKIDGIRAALCSDPFSAKFTRLHNDANVICLGGRTIGPGIACDMVDVFLNTGFEGGRHATRVDKMMRLEKN